MSRTTQDQVIDDDENETCPLCIEEFDLSDRGFKPCPCGYQICQFCYNNIKTTMNGLCPACRRPYDDKNIQFKMPTTEELASHKESAANAAKKKAAQRQKEIAKREADTVSRRHLQGIRVRQKNLVYVTGMRPTSSPEHLSEMLRRDEYFGQYGKIVKVVVSKAKEGQSNAPVGIYVTFESKEAAARCIAAVDGSQNFDTRLRAQYGTTKYCSAYLRGEQCTKQGCLFLHEPGEENESFTRQDLSSMNSMHTQLPASSSSHPPLSQAPPQHAPQTIAAAAPPMDRENSREGSASGVSVNDGPALPAGATWARSAPSRRTSQVPSVSTSSPLVQSAVPVTVQGTEIKRSSSTVPKAGSTLSQAALPSREASPESEPETDDFEPVQSESLPDMEGLRQACLSTLNVSFHFDESRFSRERLAEIDSFPPLFDKYGGARRLAREMLLENANKKDSDGAQAARQALSAIDIDSAPESGSLQLGGEPDDGTANVEQLRRQQTLQSASENRLASPGPSLDNSSSPAGLISRTLSPQQQQQQFLLQQLKSSSPNPLGGAPLAHQSSHTRQASRFSFANDSTASASVKPVTNPKLMNQQSSMMPSQHQFSQGQAIGSNQTFPSGVQGPPPGLKTTGTPSVSGGGMFGQGHGFATAGLGFSTNTSTRNDEMMRELMRARGGSAGSGQASDGGRREFMFPSSSSSLQQISQSSSPAPAPGLSSFPYGPQAAASFNELGGPQKQKKKTKKHRHANTSSSGGAVVDHADPSILQARIQQASSGHGLYGNVQNHGPGGFNSMMYGGGGGSGSGGGSNTGGGNNSGGAGQYGRW